VSRPLNRFDRHLLPSAAYTTYQIAAPRATHYRPATCEEYGCLKWRNGWRVHVQALTAEQLHAVTTSGYRYQPVEVDPEHTYFDFEAGQPCFHAGDHQVPVGKPALFVVRHGDHRRSTVERVHTRPEDWRDQFAEHTDRWATAVQRG
jgi:hypothetical protein